MTPPASTGAEALIDHSALTHNLSQVRALAPRSRVLAVVKADAYGHGLIDCARALADADGFSVARLCEAMRLRDAGFTQRIVLLCGAMSADELARCRASAIDVVVHTFEQVEIIEQADTGAPLNAWLKLDSGMHRLGFGPSELPSVCRRLADLDVLGEPLRVLTHLADADHTELPNTDRQIDCTFDACDGLDVEVSIANSAAVLAHPRAHADWVRPGIMLYGVSPFRDRSGADHGLRAAMILRTRLLSVHRIAAEQPIGYGGRYLTPQSMPVGAAAIGYADGFPRNAPDATRLIVGRSDALLAGRVSMDTITLDLRTAADAKTGDEVTVWGPQLPVERLAEVCDTIGYELLVRVGSRVPRRPLR